MFNSGFMVLQKESDYYKNGSVLCFDLRDCLELVAMKELCDGQLKLYSNVVASEVEWLWYPYIPFGKLTVLQGDPGCGKSTLMMSIIAAMTAGGLLPDGRRMKKTLHAIYQCSEDSAEDTIRPRLISAGADCGNVAFLDEEQHWLTLDDDQLRRAIADFNARLLVIDPLQAYLGDTDISCASGMRRMLRQLAIWASLYDCAIVLVGHMNKKQGSRDLYRGLGSIDVVAAARSVLQVEPHSEDEDIMVLRHVKSSLAPRGKDRGFYIDARAKICWVDLPSSNGQLSPADDINLPQPHVSKQMLVAEKLKALLVSGPMKSTEIMTAFSDEEYSEKTLMLAKKLAGVRSVKQDGVWYWQLPGR